MSGRIGRYVRSNVLGLVAIFIALGGSAYAAGLARDSVKAKQIKAGAVATSELADNAVTSPKVEDGSLLGQDFAAGQLPSGATGPQGPSGATGPQGATGLRGAPAVAYFAKQEVDGPLPRTLTFTGVPQGNAIIRVEGTAYATAVGRYWVNVNPSNVDFCGASARFPTLFFNQTSVHAALMPMTSQVCFPAAGAHTVGLTASSANLRTDDADFFTVSLTVYGSDTTVNAAPAAEGAAGPAPAMSPGT